MRVLAFAAALSAMEEDAGGVTAKGFPMTSCQVNNFPAHITVPMVVSVCTQGGTEYDPVRYIIATSPNGERVGALKFGWHWPDNPPTPIKYRVFTQYLPIRVQAPGLYEIGLYDSMEPDAETDHIYPLPVLKANPLIP